MLIYGGKSYVEVGRYMYVGTIPFGIAKQPGIFLPNRYSYSVTKVLT